MWVSNTFSILISHLQTFSKKIKKNLRTQKCWTLTQKSKANYWIVKPSDDSNFFTLVHEICSVLSSSLLYGVYTCIQNATCFTWQYPNGLELRTLTYINAIYYPREREYQIMAKNLIVLEIHNTIINWKEYESAKFQLSQMF